eukprot:Nitzschia sp. Nitz4//scaffold2_size372955//175278//176710//NITZ4_000421-RA/size372955-snap-gene-0.30-mRNA-1//1//CDS//3329546772//5955//frame0
MADTATPTAEASNGSFASPPPNKVAAQLTKLRDANLKYKNLLKMAKERIEQQEQELKKYKDAKPSDVDDKSSSPNELMGMETNSNPDIDMPELGPAIIDPAAILRICQRTQDDATGEVWALFELDPHDPDAMLHPTPSQRILQWKKFDSESALIDFIRRDTGEPLTLPPFSLTPQQSARLQEKAKQEVQQIREELRRLRVRSDIAKKEADAQIRELRNAQVESTKHSIELQDATQSVDQSRTQHNKLEQLQAEMASQEAQWKEAYDVLMAENTALKSSGSDALLASQWRQRYETCCKEKEQAQHQLKVEKAKGDPVEAGKYELKYRDLKESFRLYRKKAKEIFEAQQSGGQPSLLQMSEKSNEDSKLSYLKNLMVNYLTSDLAVREHMEGAIGTVLQFTPDDIAKIEQKKKESDYWGLF